MSRPFHSVVVLVLLLAAAVTSGSKFAQAAESAPEITVSFAFPDGTTKSTSVTLAEVERLTGQRPAYTLLPWVVAALKKLELPHETAADPKGVRLTAVGGVANGARGEWVYSANGLVSPYRLDTQTIEGISLVAFSYRKQPP
jgi:hypothetical protein